MSIIKEIEKLRNMTVAQLVGKYEKLFGKPPRIRHKEYLWKRCAWRLQERRYGGLPGAALRQLDAIIEEIDIPVEEKRRTVTGRIRRSGQGSDLVAGTTLVRIWHGREYRLTVLDDGFEVDGVIYASLSAAARGITGSRWNGNLFWGVTSRGKK